MTAFTPHTPDTAPEGSNEQLEGVEVAWRFIPSPHRVPAGRGDVG